jgi:hypothetical protein
MAQEDSGLNKLYAILHAINQAVLIFERFQAAPGAGFRRAAASNSSLESKASKASPQAVLPPGTGLELFPSNCARETQHASP